MTKPNKNWPPVLSILFQFFSCVVSRHFNVRFSICCCWKFTLCFDVDVFFPSKHIKIYKFLRWVFSLPIFCLFVCRLYTTDENLYTHAVHSSLMNFCLFTLNYSRKCMRHMTFINHTLNPHLHRKSRMIEYNLAKANAYLIVFVYTLSLHPINCSRSNANGSSNGKHFSIQSVY